eukprot:6212464-Pleurochrysis_carterae.AAC.2
MQSAGINMLRACMQPQLQLQLHTQFFGPSRQCSMRRKPDSTTTKSYTIPAKVKLKGVASVFVALAPLFCMTPRLEFNHEPGD